MMVDLILRETDPDTLRALIVRDVVAAIRPLIKESLTSPSPITGREGMAKILTWSVTTLDRRTKDGTIPSMLDGDRRLYVIADVIESIEAGTAAAEAKASRRQKAKQDAKQNGGRCG